MSKSEKNPKVDFFYKKPNKWQPELAKLRLLALESGLTEELKWGVPCYTHEGRNILLIHDFKDYCALLFVKGALVRDPDDLLIQQTKNVQAGRQIRFVNMSEIEETMPALKRYIREAIRVEKAGLQVKKKKTSEYPVPEELQDALNRDASFKTAFYALTPGRQRGYLLFFAAPKLSKTRVARIEKYRKPIMKGLGVYDDR